MTEGRYKLGQILHVGRYGGIEGIVLEVVPPGRLPTLLETRRGPREKESYILGIPRYTGPRRVREEQLELKYLWPDNEALTLIQIEGELQAILQFTTGTQVYRPPL
jgi:hypothetical protein